jgi:hypothetical protein
MPGDPLERQARPDDTADDDHDARRPEGEVKRAPSSPSDPPADPREPLNPA